MFRNVLLLVLSGSLLTLGAEAQNLLQNGNFDTDLSGWNLDIDEGITSFWISEDVGGAGNSGSISSINSEINGNQGKRPATQCVQVTAGEAYDVGASIRIPTSDSAFDEAQVSVLWHTDNQCATTFVGGTIPIFHDTAGDWVTLSDEVTVPANIQSATIALDQKKGMAGGVFEVRFDSVFFRPVNGGGPCVEDATTLCLREDRFSVTSTWRRPNGAEGVGTAVELTNDTGYFWFFNEANVEMVVKVLNGCSNTNHFWVFAGGLTNVEVELTVTDTQNGTVSTYTNPLSTPFQPIQDTQAFATCP
ncbi:MAG: hypothetical protein K0U98_11795 [Deltaproteobacteria bacterium]|nr:hypothetical protein [Deltaproteobacteria bacterium]